MVEVCECKRALQIWGIDYHWFCRFLCFTSHTSYSTWAHIFPGWKVVHKKQSSWPACWIALGHWLCCTHASVWIHAVGIALMRANACQSEDMMWNHQPMLEAIITEIYIYRLHGFEWIWIEKIEYDNMDTETQHRDFLSLNVELLCHDADGEAISHLLPLVVSSWVQYPAIVPCHVTQFQSIVLLCPIRGSNGRL